MNLCPRKSVGAVIKNDKGEFLCLYRRRFPEGLAFLAGHLDFVDGQLEGPEVALKREVLEEAGLVVNDCYLVCHQTFPNLCSLGFNCHEWFVYEVTDYSGQPRLMESDKHEWVRFLSIDEIKEFIEEGDYDPAWVEFTFPFLGIL